MSGSLGDLAARMRACRVCEAKKPWLTEQLLPEARRLAMINLLT
jgi:hypothetical protein